MNNWQHKGPREYYIKAKKLFGKPIFAANVKNGIALWKTQGLFNEHMLRDEYISHCVPAQHHDYFYSSVHFYIPPKLLKDVLRISGSINYDGLKKLVTARCASIQANIATLYLAMNVGSGKMKIAQVKKEGLYGKYIRGEMKSHNEMKSDMIIMKKHNNKKYKKQLIAPFYNLAFAHC